MQIYSRLTETILRRAKEMDDHFFQAQILLGAFLHQDELDQEQLEKLKKDTKEFLDAIQQNSLV